MPTIGFANSLSHTIIREQQEEDTRSIASSSISVTDEELALLGAPWAKEGMLQRKHYWEVQGKRSKEKNWLKAFVVISQGELRMFRFDGGGGSSAKRGTGMGGGDWTVSDMSLLTRVVRSLMQQSPRTVQRFQRRRNLSHTRALFGYASSWLLPGTTSLFRSDPALRWHLLLPSGNA